MTTSDLIQLGLLVVATIGLLGAAIEFLVGRRKARRPVRVGHVRPTAGRLPDDPGGSAVSRDDRDAVRLAHVFLANRSELPEDVTISDSSRVLWPVGRRCRIQPRTVKLPPHGAGNARVMVISHHWPNGDRRFLLSIRGETSLGDRVKGRVWTRLTGFQWAEPPGLAG